MDSPKPLRVLIAEDEDSFRMALQRILLTHKEYDFHACASGNEVLEALREQQYDVIILDYQMPERSGLNIIQWMLEQKMDTPVIMLTGAGSEDIAVEAMKLGAYDYIPKEHFDKKHLPHIINSTFERYMFRKERAQRERAMEFQKSAGETFALLSRCISSFEELMTTSLASTQTELDANEKESLANLPANSVGLVAHTFHLFRQQHEMMTFASRMLLDLSRLVLERLTTDMTNEGQQIGLKLLLEQFEGFLQRSRLHSEE